MGCDVIVLLWITTVGCLVIAGILGCITAWMLLKKKMPPLTVFCYTAVASFGTYFTVAFFDQTTGIPRLVLALIALPWAIGFGDGNAAYYISLACQGLITWMLSIVVWLIIRKVLKAGQPHL